MLQENCRIKGCSPWSLGTSKPFSGSPWHVWSFSPAAWATVFLLHIPMRASQLDFIKLQKRWANRSETIACAIVKIEFGETPMGTCNWNGENVLSQHASIVSNYLVCRNWKNCCGSVGMTVKKWKVYVQFQGTFKQGPFLTLLISKLRALAIGR